VPQRPNSGKTEDTAPQRAVAPYRKRVWEALTDRKGRVFALVGERKDRVSRFFEREPPSAGLDRAFFAGRGDIFDNNPDTPRMCVKQGDNPPFSAAGIFEVVYALCLRGALPS